MLPGVVVGNASPELEQALKELHQSDTDWRRERDLYRSQRQSGAIAGVEAAEYAEFVASLQRQKFENCEKVYRIGGAPALEGTDCLAARESENGVNRQTALPEPAATDAEKLETLEQKLKGLEAALDEQLSHAQQANREKAGSRVARLPRGSGSAGTSGDRPGTGDSDGRGGSPKWSDPDADKSGTSETTSPSQDNGNGQSPEAADTASRTAPDGRHDAGAGTDGEQKTKSAPVATGAGESGDDDDVVLRQVREAAEKETDPVLKEKLWEEYRKMKAARK